MVPQEGLMASVSSPGAACYMYGPAYGAQKVVHEQTGLRHGGGPRPVGASTIALWLGILRTERVEIAQRDHPQEYEKFKGVEEAPSSRDGSSTPSPRCRIWRNERPSFIFPESGIKYGVTDVDGRQPPPFREMLQGLLLDRLVAQRRGR
ncbi:hypothetical protein AB5I41_14880 [Sphingomonas sp. MMS24-JH45]